MNSKLGFTITELVIVIVVIGIIAAISIVMYPQFVIRSQTLKTKSELNSIVEVIDIATAKTDKTLWQITEEYTESINYSDNEYPSGSGHNPYKPTYNNEKCSSSYRSSHGLSVDIRNLPVTDVCIKDMRVTWDAIYNLAGISMNTRPIIDVWGSPYLLDANENESMYVDNIFCSTASPPYAGTNYDSVKSVGADGINHNDQLHDDVYPEKPPDKIVCP